VCAAILGAILQHALNLTETAAVAIGMLYFATVGVGAAMVAANYRKKGNVDTALTAYRIAVWCWFLAFMVALSFHGAIERDEMKKRHDEERRRIEQHWHKE
jgi:hypothetical protein